MVWPLFWQEELSPSFDEVLRVDHSGRGKPSPFLLRPSQVAGLHCSAGPRGEAGSYGEEEFVGNGILIGAVLVPPNATAATAVPAGGHVRKDLFRHVQVLSTVRFFVGRDPSERPPALIVVIVVEESAAAAPSATRARTLSRHERAETHREKPAGPSLTRERPRLHCFRVDVVAHELESPPADSADRSESRCPR